MLKDQLIAFALLIPFLYGGQPDAKKANPEPKKGTTAVAMDPPMASKADDRKPPVSVKKEETKSAETKKEETKPLVPKKEESKPPVVKKEEPRNPPAEIKKTPEQKDAEAGKTVEPKQGSLPVAATKPAPAPYQEVTIGTGAKVAAGERAVFHFAVADAQGKELVNSKKRGLPFTVEAGTGDELWGAMLKDMKVGGIRKMALVAEQVNAGKGLPPYIPPGMAVTVTVWLLRAEKR
jgi:FKBP-type peptidyl-prolyl cis-trans isomerase